MGQSDRCSDIGSGRSSRLTGKRQEFCLAEWREGVEGFLREVSFSGSGRTCRSSLGRGREGREMNLRELESVWGPWSSFMSLNGVRGEA